MQGLVKWLKFCAAFVIGALISALGGFDTLLKICVTIVIIDYASGLLRALVKGEASSKVGFRGIAKKMAIFLVIALAVQVEDWLGPQLAIREIVISFYTMNEGLSVLENLGEIIAIPSFLRDRIASLEKKDNDRQD